jgi:hypothetical protein
MTRRQMVMALSTLMILTAASVHAADGVLIAQKRTTATGAVTTSQVQIEKTRMRAESDAAGGRKMTMIFDGTEQVLRTVDDETKSYSEMTKADVDKLSGQMSGAMAQMQEQMKNLPPETRARMEEMMKGRGAAMPGPTGTPTAYKNVGTDKVGKWTCDKYEGSRDGVKVSEVCTVAPAALGFAASDFAVTKQMAEFFSKLVPQGADQLFQVGSETPNSFAGVPVRTVTFRNGAVSSTTEITDVSRQNIPDSAFAVPAGYQKRDMMGGRGRGRQ